MSLEVIHKQHLRSIPTDPRAAPIHERYTCYGRQPKQETEKLQNCATLRVLLRLDVAGRRSFGSHLALFLTWIDVFAADRHCYRFLENVMDTAHLLCATFHVCCTHAIRDGSALLGGDWCEALCSEEFYTVLLVSQIALETQEYYGRIRTEVEDFRIPLYEVSGYTVLRGKLRLLPYP